MLKWKRVSVTAEATYEELADALAGMSGKNRVIKFLADTENTVGVRIRVYRDADQIVDYDCRLLTNEAPLLPMDLSLSEGQLCQVGIQNGSGAAETHIIAIGYEEAD